MEVPETSNLRFFRSSFGIYVNIIGPPLPSPMWKVSTWVAEMLDQVAELVDGDKINCVGFSSSMMTSLIS